jgi:hypothetical protein
VKNIDDKELIQILKMAKQIGCNESFLNMLLKEVEKRKLQDTGPDNFSVNSSLSAGVFASEDYVTKNPKR